ncbi:glycoside hydrolase family 71/99-like protein [Pontibacter sp. G13]|uniref:glycoside hydrolase family 71/99-like protein n=1 Tax=Pontibacter sp. G13 TaxID=3074898 RepID=UPI0028890C05|nr:glycoside hydrolase family 71/99-like protein [Pontibacter sp. G13]WNJ20450.1 glycoside hydrolase family 71/99-like protein [Pontibacter sp. G13]
MIRQALPLTFAVLLLLVCNCTPEKPITPDPAPAEPVAVSKTNSTRLYMHYMPWFHSKEYSGYWGSHWRMANRNPSEVLSNGQREIAAHYYPLVGPYDSGDPDLVDYHLLLMKYAGIDGVLIDWYGSHNVLDYGANLNNSNALIDGVGRTGLEFGIVYEEFTAEEVGRRNTFSALDAAKMDMEYLETEYFSSDRYIQMNGKPLLLTFGPRYFQSSTQWTQILGSLSSPTTFLPLWGFDHMIGSKASGEFAWVDFDPGLGSMSSFYSSNVGVKLGAACPGFHDYYVQGGWGQSYGFLDHQNGQTFADQLQLAADENAPYLQLVTWNDFGEGTMIEPTVEFEYQFLEQIQAFAGVPYGRHELEIVFEYYTQRKALANDPDAQQTLDAVFNALNQLDVAQAESLLSGL